MIAARRTKAAGDTILDTTRSSSIVIAILSATTGPITVTPTGLDPAGTYAVRCLHAGMVGTATGADLMSRGIDVLAAPTAPHILLFESQRTSDKAGDGCHKDFTDAVLFDSSDPSDWLN